MKTRNSTITDAKSIIFKVVFGAVTQETSKIKLWERNRLKSIPICSSEVVVYLPNLNILAFKITLIKIKVLNVQQTFKYQ